MKKTGKITGTLIILTGAAALLAGCSGGGSSSAPAQTQAAETEAAQTQAAESQAAEEGEVKTVVVGTGIEYPPYCYVDEDGNTAGFDVEVMRAVDELLPQYEFEFEQSEFTALWTSLEAGKYDLIVHQIQYNEERGAKYLYSDEYYAKKRTYITVLTENEDIHSIQDLADLDKIVYEPNGNASLVVWEKWNEEHPDNQITVDIEAFLADDVLIASMQSGKFDACIKVERDVATINENYGEVLKTVGDPVTDTNCYVVFRKDDPEEEALKEAVNGAIAELKESGQLAQISIDVLGKDYTSE